jgi:hypothetical protein
MNESKRLLEDWIISLSEQLKCEDKNVISCNEAVSKEVEDRLLVNSAYHTMVPKGVDETIA